MKLIRKINHNFISLAIFILFVGGVVFYIMLRKLMLDQIDSRLLESKILIEEKFEDFLIYPEHYVWNEELISIAYIDNKANSTVFISDTLLGNSQIIKQSAFRKLEFQHNFDNLNYKIKIFKELRFTDDLTLQIMMLLSFIAVFFMLSFFLVFRFVAQSSLFDFYDTIKKIRDFKVDEVANTTLIESDVDEFEDLNKVLRFMTHKIKKDYSNLREYTENASHEIQTPLAIIQNKVEQLIQGDNISENQLKSFSDILDATTRLSKLNSGLLQLVKIESGQYIETKDIDIKSIVLNIINQLDEFIYSKNISLETKFDSCNHVNINPNLAELLITNLIKNAIKHNINNGKLVIEMEENVFKISNSGILNAIDIDNLSKRFTKGTNSNSLGLGLAIVHKICKNYSIDLEYSYKSEMHTIVLYFN